MFQPVETLFTKLLFLFVRIMPARFSVWLGGVVGAAAFSLFRVRRHVAMVNLDIAFPEKSANEKAAIGRRANANLGRSMMEILLLQKINADYFAKHLSIEGLEHMKNALEKGKGVLTVTGHFGSWELMAASIPKQGIPVTLLVGEQKNKKVDDLFNDLRQKHELDLVPLDQALRGVLRALKNNRAVALLGDQEARRGAGIEIDFFGKPAQTYPGVALFSIKAKSPIICPFIVRKGTGLDHVVHLEPPIEFTPTGNRDEDLQTLTQLHANSLETWIRKHPDHWFWGHKRWKSHGVY